LISSIVAGYGELTGSRNPSALSFGSKIPPSDAKFLMNLSHGRSLFSPMNVRDTARLPECRERLDALAAEVAEFSRSWAASEDLPSLARSLGRAGAPNR